MTKTEKKQTVFAYILLIANKLQIFGDSIMKEFTLKQWFLMLMITKMDTLEPSIKQIADFTGSTRQNVKKMLESMEKKGYIKMEPSQEDARALSVIVTQKAYEYLKKHKADGENLVNLIFNGVDEKKLDVVIDMSDQIFVNLQNSGKKMRKIDEE